MNSVTRFGWCVLLASALAGCAARRGAGSISALEAEKLPGTNQVKSVRYDWVDSKRGRPVPVKIYFPQSGPGPFPVILFSHGMGGNRDGYEYLGRHWASHGYVSVHVQHLGSDDSVWGPTPWHGMEKMMRAATNAQNALNRPIDISFVIDQLGLLNREDPKLRDRLDLQRIGMAGHSFGAFTTLAIAGETFKMPDGQRLTMPDHRVKAAVVMSAPPLLSKTDSDAAFSNVKLPSLHMTGTADNSPISETKPEDRRLHFEHITGADQFLLTFNGGDHFIYSGHGWLPGGKMDKQFQSYICMSSTIFWDAYLKGDSRVRQWLAGEDFAQALGQVGSFEKKLSILR